MFETEDPGKFRVHMGEEVVFIDDDGTDEVYDGPGIMILGHDDKSIRIITARTEKRADRMLVLRGELHELSRLSIRIPESILIISRRSCGIGSGWNFPDRGSG